MRIPEYWTRVALDLDGAPDPLGPAIAFGWSEVSAAEAHDHARERALRVAAALRVWNGDRDLGLVESWEYYPLDRPLCEPIVERLTDAAGALRGAITRNGYGAFVLNTTRVMFLDLDLPAPVTGWRAWFGQRAPPDDLPDRVRAEVAKRPDFGLRLYRTAAGYRALVTSGTFDPVARETGALFAAFGVDPLYARLTTAQACFRARLTPKPWRIGFPSPQVHWYPFDAEREARFLAWDAGYRGHRAGFSVCGPPVALGVAEVDPEVAPLLALHDAWCCTGQPQLA